MLSLVTFLAAAWTDRYAGPLSERPNSDSRGRWPTGQQNVGVLVAVDAVESNGPTSIRSSLDAV